MSKHVLGFPLKETALIDTIDRMSRIINEDRVNPKVIRLMDKICDEAGIKEENRNKKYKKLAKIRAVFEYVKNLVDYVEDPYDIEYIQHTLKTLLERLKGDCDDYTIAICSLLLSHNIPCRIRIVATEKEGRFDHVYPVAIWDGKKIALDAIYKNRQIGQEPPLIYSKKDFDINDIATQFTGERNRAMTITLSGDREIIKALITVGKVEAKKNGDQKAYKFFNYFDKSNNDEGISDEDLRYYKSLIKSEPDKASETLAGMMDEYTGLGFFKNLWGGAKRLWKGAKKVVGKVIRNPIIKGAVGMIPGVGGALRAGMDMAGKFFPKQSQQQPQQRFNMNNMINNAGNMVRNVSNMSRNTGNNMSNIFSQFNPQMLSSFFQNMMSNFNRQRQAFNGIETMNTKTIKSLAGNLRGFDNFIYGVKELSGYNDANRLSKSFFSRMMPRAKELMKKAKDNEKSKRPPAKNVDPRRKEGDIEKLKRKIERSSRRNEAEITKDTENKIRRMEQQYRRADDNGKTILRNKINRLKADNYKRYYIMWNKLSEDERQEIIEDFKQYDIPQINLNNPPEGTNTFLAEQVDKAKLMAVQDYKENQRSAVTNRNSLIAELKSLLTDYKEQKELRKQFDMLSEQVKSINNEIDKLREETKTEKLNGLSGNSEDIIELQKELNKKLNILNKIKLTIRERQIEELIKKNEKLNQSIENLKNKDIPEKNKSIKKLQDEVKSNENTIKELTNKQTNTLKELDEVKGNAEQLSKTYKEYINNLAETSLKRNRFLVKRMKDLAKLLSHSKNVYNLLPDESKLMIDKIESMGINLDNPTPEGINKLYKKLNQVLIENRKLKTDYKNSVKKMIKVVKANFTKVDNIIYQIGNDLDIIKNGLFSLNDIDSDLINMYNQLTEEYKSIRSIQKEYLKEPDQFKMQSLIDKSKNLAEDVKTLLIKTYTGDKNVNNNNVSNNINDVSNVEDFEEGYEIEVRF